VKENRQTRLRWPARHWESLLLLRNEVGIYRVPFQEDQLLKARLHGLWHHLLVAGVCLIRMDVSARTYQLAIRVTFQNGIDVSVPAISTFPVISQYGEVTRRCRFEAANSALYLALSDVGFRWPPYIIELNSIHNEQQVRSSKLSRSYLRIGTQQTTTTTPPRRLHHVNLAAGQLQQGSRTRRGRPTRTASSAASHRSMHSPIQLRPSALISIRYHAITDTKF
jgi:hypothetical protein